MNKSFLSTAGATVIAAAVVSWCLIHTASVSATTKGPAFTTDGKLVQPKGYHTWVFVGSMVTPNGLNNGKAGFPEFHNVYVEPANLAAYRQTGIFSEGTVLVKELTLVRDPKHPDGSADEASGRGYFEGVLNGMDVTVKDSRRFSSTNNWGFFNFGHHAMPYAEASTASPKEECAGCHIAGASKTDLTWVQFYPMLHTKN